HDFGQAFEAAGVSVDGDDRHHDAVFGEVAAVANDHVLHHVVHRSGIDADPAHGDPPGFARAMVVDLQNVAGFHDEALFHPGEAQVLGQPGVFGKLPELAVNRHEEARPHQVQHELHLFDAAVAGDVHRRV